MYDFTILHPSSRPHQWRKVFDAWIGQAANPGRVQYILTGDRRWGFPKHHDTHDMGLRATDMYLDVYPGRRCYVEAVNQAAKYAQGRTIIVIADDQYPCGKWDTQLAQSARGLPIGGMDEYVFRVPTGTLNEIERNITVMPILSLSRYRRLGYILYPGYESMYSDNDLTEHAQQDGVFHDIPTPQFPHLHPINTGKKVEEWDEQYQAQNRKEAYDLGVNLLNIRRATGFGTRPLTIPQGQTQDQGQTQATRKTIAVCLPGETFSSTVMSSWTGLLVNLFSRYNVVPIFCHVSNVHVTRGVLAEQVIQNMNTDPKPDYVLWIDDDNPTDWEHVQQLLIDLDHVPEADMVVGWCWIWDQLNNKFIASCGHLNEYNSTCLSHTLETLADSEFDLLPIGYSGFPLVLMRASVLTRVKEQHPHPFSPIYDSSHPWGAMSEDTAFCRRVRESGMNMFVDRRVRVDHLKTVAHGPAIKITGRHQVIASGQTILPAAEPNQNQDPVTVATHKKGD